MPFSSQFALSLEVTRLVPLGLAVNKAAEAVMSCARDLRHSGSDIVTEEDLANVFGRSRIDASLASSFKTIVCRNGSRVPLWESIVLQAGPGPTVFRALKEPAYFSMLVQISFLAWSCDAGNLANGLSTCFQRRIAGAPQDQTTFSAVPDRTSIFTTVQACERQTSMFNWNNLLYAVSATLGYPSDEAGEISIIILQGALDMFPMVQSLPEDRFVRIQVGQTPEQGHHACIRTYVVWAHLILGLSVTVRGRHDRDKVKLPDCHFGLPGLPQILIEEVPEGSDNTITLLDATNETLFLIKPEPDHESNSMLSAHRIPLRGFGNSYLHDAFSYLEIFIPSSAIIEDLQLVVCAFAQLVCEKLVRDTSERGREKDCSDEKMHQLRGSIPSTIRKKRLLNASKFLFDNANIRKADIEQYKILYSKQALGESLSLPLTLNVMAKNVSRQQDTVRAEWSQITYYCQTLCLFLLSVANVENFEVLDDFTINGVGTLSTHKHNLSTQVSTWDGHRELLVQEHSWLEIFAVPFLGHTWTLSTVPWNRTCVISDRGWSAWISTFDDTDPSFIQGGSFFVGRGSPCRNGVWKTCVRDMDLPIDVSEKEPLVRAEATGQTSQLRCANDAKIRTPFCGEADRFFLIGCRFLFQLTSYPSRPWTERRAGYRELQRSLWWTLKAIRCVHGGPETESIVLPPNCCTIYGFGDKIKDTCERVVVYLTAHNRAARWMALLCFNEVFFIGVQDQEPSYSRKLLLRGNDCCFQCAIAQAAEKPGRWFVIL